MIKVIELVNTISIEYLNFLANSMRLSKVDFESEIKFSAVVKLFELGKISIGIASKALGISRIEFLENYRVSFLNSDDVDLDYENA